MPHPTALSNLVAEPIEMSLWNAHERRSKLGCTRARCSMLKELDVSVPDEIPEAVRRACADAVPSSKTRRPRSMASKPDSTGASAAPDEGERGVRSRPPALA